ncbi:MAG: hypothetical protein JWP17_2819 [Solirubrobacterales bacterium]|jgi:hypothetical protein|nr:hypothetical protein [Solirubrobacterales bacterium]
MSTTVLFAIANNDKPLALGIGLGFALIALALVVFGFWIGRTRDDEAE